MMLDFVAQMCWNNCLYLVERHDNPRQEDQGRKGKETKRSWQC